MIEKIERVLGTRPRLLFSAAWFIVWGIVFVPTVFLIRAGPAVDLRTEPESCAAPVSYVTAEKRLEHASEEQREIEERRSLLERVAVLEARLRVMEKLCRCGK